MAKRGRGEGSIRHRPDGLWEARVTLPSGARKSVYAKTRAECAERLRRLVQDVSEGKPTGHDRLTVGEFLTTWLETAARPSIRPGTYHSYENHVRLHLVPDLGRYRLVSLTPDQVQRFINSLSEGDRSPTTVARIRGTLRRALAQAVAWGYVSRNVAALTHAPKQVRYIPQFLDPSQAQIFLAHASPDRLGALFVLALGVGPRLGEALALQWADVDLDAGTVRIDKTLHRNHGVSVLAPPKSERARRTVTLPPFVVRALRRHRTAQIEERLAAGGTWSEPGPTGGHVFVSGAGGPLDGSTVLGRLHIILERAGLPRMRFHDLRHSCASLLLARGVSPRVVQEILGHSTIVLTLGTYSHVIPSLQQDAADRMEEMLSDASG